MVALKLRGYAFSQQRPSLTSDKNNEKNKIDIITSNNNTRRV